MSKKNFNISTKKNKRKKSIKYPSHFNFIADTKNAYVMATEPLTEPLDKQVTEEPKFKHVDDFIVYGGHCMTERSPNEDYARWVLNHFRLSASS